MICEELILIHTSVKLVTNIAARRGTLMIILIHTSVKLVTNLIRLHLGQSPILIHTSVKLVTEVTLEEGFSSSF